MATKENCATNAALILVVYTETARSPGTATVSLVGGESAATFPSEVRSLKLKVWKGPSFLINRHTVRSCTHKKDVNCSKEK